MAKKILAAVVAVMVAISAMAVNVFAEDAKIELKSVNGADIWGQNQLNQMNPVQAGAATKINVTMTFDVPIYPLYGLLGSENYLMFDLPVPLASDNGNPVDRIDWSLIVNGTEYTLRAVTRDDIANAGDGRFVTVENSTNTNLDGVRNRVRISHHRVRVGSLVHGYNVTTDDTIIPNSTSYGDYSNIRLVANVTIDNTPTPDAVTGLLTQPYSQWYFGYGADAFKTGGDFANVAKVQVYDGQTNQPNLNAVSFIYLWNPQVSYTDTNVNGNFAFANPDWTTAALTQVQNGAQVTSFEANTLAWDHTIQNKAIIMGSTADTVKLVVELSNPLVGGATYTLWARNDNTTAINWWQYDTSRTYVSQVTLLGTLDKLEFDVPVSVLIDQNYGSQATNQEFVIFENITLMNATLMRNYLHYNAAWGNGALNLGQYSGKFFGNYWVGWDDHVEYRTDGENHSPLRYAAGGLTSLRQVDLDGDGQLENNPNHYLYRNNNGNETFDNNTCATPASATSAYLLIPQEDATEVQNPTQETENNEENEDVNDNDAPEVDVNDGEDTTPEANAPADESENPSTGVALAVIPMIISAAAAVISKKH